MDFVFDSRSRLYRSPVGAVTAGSVIDFGIESDAGAGIKKMALELFEDETGWRHIINMDPVSTENKRTRWECSFTPGETGLWWYGFRADDRPIRKCGGYPAYTDEYGPCWQLTVYSPDFVTPDWIKGGVFYHIFVDRFCKKGELPLREDAVRRQNWGGLPEYRPNSMGEVLNNDFFGGNLAGIIEKLPYLLELGITCIYLSPIFEAASNHKYDTGDYLKIDPSFGDESDLIFLCDQAKKLGIRVILDGVFNHTGDDSVYFDRYGRYGGNGAYNSQSSPYYDWFSFTQWPQEYESWWGIKTLPQVREEDEGYREFILGKNGVLEKWMDAGISGWRLDVADELPESFLRGLRTTVKKKDPNALIIGEVWEDASNKIAYGSRRHYFDGSELDGVMNYPYKNAIVNYILSGDAASMAEAVENIIENYPKPALDCLMNGLGTHDTARILTVLGGVGYESRDDRARAKMTQQQRYTALKRLYPSVLLQFSLPGVPCIYYGDEAEMEGYEDPFNRRCFPWGDENKDLTDWYRALARARREHNAFVDGECEIIAASGGLFVFRRIGPEDMIIAAVNAGKDTREIKLPGCSQLLVSRGAELTEGSLTLESYGCALII